MTLRLQKQCQNKFLSKSVDQSMCFDIDDNFDDEEEQMLNLVNISGNAVYDQNQFGHLTGSTSKSRRSFNSNRYVGDEGYCNSNSSSSLRYSKMFSACDTLKTVQVKQFSAPTNLSTASRKPLSLVKLGLKEKLEGKGASIGTPLFFFTSSIIGMKQWTRYRDEIQIIVELYGTLDSVSQDLRYSSGKWLKLVDQGNVLNCIYYEIDRALPNLTLRQWVRCAGIIQRDGTLLCLSVRPATQQEYQWRNKLTSFGAKAMYTRIAELSES